MHTDEAASTCKRDKFIDIVQRMAPMILHPNYLNVLYKRVANISEWRIFNYPTTTILDCNTTTLRTNDNYIRSS